MSDGAHLGISAERALGTILGGDDQPTEEEHQTPQQVRERIEKVPLFEGEPPEFSYSSATDAIAHAFLVLLEADRTLLEPTYYPDDYEIETLRGMRKDAASPVWDAMMERWPHADNWIGGASGFMVGFAFNTALYAGEFNLQASNPAIIEIEVDDS